MTSKQQVLRVFEVRAKPDASGELKEKLSHTSIAVVKGEPGNQGYYFGELQQSDDRDLVFISVWSDMEAVKRRFGEDWAESFLPEGYEELIESCSVKHYQVSGKVGLQSG